MDYNLLAEMLIPGIDKTTQDYINLYPKRNLSDGALVTRYAPSPTGFQHLGSVFAALISERLAHQSGGVFYLRIEDTDKKREVKGAIEDTINTLESFGIKFDEGVTSSFDEKGNYGPYKQSNREAIYKAFIKDLIAKGLAYPCFCTENDLADIRTLQQNAKVRTGYYGKWAKCRDMSLDKIEQFISKSKPYVIRLKSHGNPDQKINCIDLIKGTVSMPENDQDIVILKSNGLPTYHFAHAVDDFLMGTTHVIRGEEWFPSLPLHLQLFEILGFKAPSYAHIPNIMKIDGNSKRKLSKRKDPEIAINFYRTQGFPFNAITEYLINLINSDYEDWKRIHPNKPYTNFKINLNKISQSGALFDISKLMDVSKNIIANMDCNTVYELYLDWANKYDSEISSMLIQAPAYSKMIFNIERQVEKPRKDLGKWSDVRNTIEYFFDPIFKENICKGYNFTEKISFDEAKDILSIYKDMYNHSDDKNTWFLRIKELCEKTGYAKDIKSYKKNPNVYKGNVTDVATVIRVALTNKTNTPDLYEIMQVMGKERVVERLSLI